MKKRSGPEAVDPVLVGKTRYEVLHWGKPRGLGQNGGHVVAVDDKTDDELWVARLYEIQYDADMEADKQDVFLTSLKLEKGGKRLLAQDERGRRFALDLDSRKVTAL